MKRPLGVFSDAVGENTEIVNPSYVSGVMIIKQENVGQLFVQITSFSMAESWLTN